jgi:hypothetical protein
MTRALPEHHRETLVKYATRLYDASTRAFRQHTYHNFDAVLKGAATTLRLAKELGPGCNPFDKAFVAMCVNDSVRDLNKALSGQGKPEFTLGEP